MLESTIEQKVRAYCHERGLLCYKFTSPAHRGVPDRLIISDSKCLFLELKAPGKKPTALQLREIARLNAKGVTATWCDSYERATQIIDETFLLKAA
jgi:hypothetical protein